jgi:hypothetical protein
LLEKIKYDLEIARTDNDVDMRYVVACLALKTSILAWPHA